MMMDDQPQGDWIGSWIEQQRRSLESMKASGGAAVDDPLRELGRKWLEAGQSYLQGWTQFVAGASPSGAAPSAPTSASASTGELLSAWQKAWNGLHASGSGLAEVIADLLGRAPPLGLAREHTEAWRELAAAQAECRNLEVELRAALTRVHSDALALLERRVSERREAGDAIATYRELYDLWVECGEKVFAEVAHSEPYCKLQAELGNATMRMRVRLQTIVESGLRQLDLPTRSELNTVHRQIRELRERVAGLEQELESSKRGASS
jgi:hypothetical protein